MTNRTVQLKGYGFGSTPAEITVTVEGVAVFTGSVPTSNTLPPSMPNLGLIAETATLCSFEIPLTFSGEKAMTCAVSNGTVVFAQIEANYTNIPNPVFSSTEYEFAINSSNHISARIDVLSAHASSPFTEDEITKLRSTDPADQTEQLAIMSAHGVSLNVSSGPTGFHEINLGSDCRANVIINGTPANPVHNSEYTGIWWWKLDNGSTMSYNLAIDSGVE